MRRRALGLLAAMLIAAGPAGGQVRRVTGVTVGNQIVVQLYVILADAQNYVPVPRQRLEVHGAADSLAFLTNDAGGGTVLLAPGAHRAIVRDPVWWNGRPLVWNVLFDVHPGMSEVLLTPRNATAGERPRKPSGARFASAGAVAGPAAVGRAGVRAASLRAPRAGRVFVMIDGTSWEVFEQALAEPGPLPGGSVADTLSALVFTSDEHTRQLDIYPRDWRELPDSALVGLHAKARIIIP